MDPTEEQAQLDLVAERLVVKFPPLPILVEKQARDWLAARVRGSTPTYP